MLTPNFPAKISIMETILTGIKHEGYESKNNHSLGGTAVSGAAALSWNGGSPETTVVGDGQTITLDCGDGLEFSEGQVVIFFIIVPAREYPKGFELTFIDSEEGRTVKTAGTTKGKKLDRSIVYLIGDVSASEVPEGTTSTLKPTAKVMTPEIFPRCRCGASQ